MQGVTLNPGIHHQQKSREVTHNWSDALRLVDTETKRQSYTRRLFVGLFSFQETPGNEQPTHWRGQESPPQSAESGSLLWAQHTWQFCSMPPSLLLKMVPGPPRLYKGPPEGRRNLSVTVRGMSCITSHEQCDVSYWAVDLVQVRPHVHQDHRCCH